MNPVRITDPVEVVNALRHGITVHYEPGDATRYTCVLVQPVQGDSAQRWLLVTNLSSGPIVLDLLRQWELHDWVAERGIPNGCWRALRPLLAALGAAPGLPVMDNQDAVREGKYR